MLAGLGATSLALAACGDDTSIAGNVSAAQVTNYDSVGFILDDGEYEFFAMPDASWTRIIGLRSDGEQALVWFRDDADAGYEPALLDLTKTEFIPLTVADAPGFFARGLTGDGRVVGGAEGDGGTEGVIYDPESGAVNWLERPGSDFTGISDAVDDVVLGYTDAGMATFVQSDDVIFDIHGDDANRLLGIQVNADNVVVGYASWGDDPMWDPLTRGFIATFDGDEYIAEPFSLPGAARTTITGINDDGRIAGHVHQADDTPMTAYSADLADPDGTLELHPLPDDVTAMLSTPGTGASVWGIDHQGRIFGALFITDPEPELWSEDEPCGGHGHLHGTECHCDDGYVLDPDDPGMCRLESDE